MQLTFSDWIISKLDEDFPLYGAIGKLQDLQPQIFKHLFKLWLMPRAQEYNHWVSEIDTWLENINVRCDVKTKTGRPSYETLIQRTQPTDKRLENLLISVGLKYNLKELQKERHIQWAKTFWNSLCKELESKDFDSFAFLKRFGL